MNVKRVSLDANVLLAEAVKRSAYVQRIRRSFLLRIHPDRFRTRPVSVRNGQSDLLKAFSDRITATDFALYVSSDDNVMLPIRHEQRRPVMNPWKTYPYYLENDKNGSLEQHSINLDENVVGILTSIATALQSSGVTNITLPPPWPVSNTNRNTIHPTPDFSFQTHHDDSTHGSSNSSSINHSFNINTNKNRNLLFFLQQYADPQDIQQRRQDRLDAQTAALVARQLFHFSSIDGTRVGWSSSSLAKSLSALATLYDDHHPKFQVPSFYPFRLVISNNDSYDETKVDVFGGGTIILHPAATPLQWLETLLTVTPQDIDQVQYYQKQQLQYVTGIQQYLPLQIRRGYTCSSLLYNTFLHRLYQDLVGDGNKPSYPLTLHSIASDVSTQSQIQLIVEAEDSQGNAFYPNHLDILPIRSRISESGCIHMSLQACMSPPQEKKHHSVVASVVACLEKYRQDAQIKRVEYLQRETEFKENIQWLKVHLGLARVFKVTPSLVTMEQLLQCTRRLLDMEESKRIVYRSHLAGLSLGITGSGHSCHLGDDGSIIVPWDWL